MRNCLLCKEKISCVSRLCSKPVTKVDIRFMCRLCLVVSVRGETVEEALQNIKEAIELYLEPVEDELIMKEAALVREIEL